MRQDSARNAAKLNPKPGLKSWPISAVAAAQAGQRMCVSSSFSEQKRSIFAKNEQKTIRLSNMDISPYPNSFGKIMFKISMDEDYQSPTVKFVGKKELFIEIINNQVKILSED